MLTRQINVAGLKIGGRNPLFLIAGPCVIEGERECLRTARELAEVAHKAGIPLIFKSSYDKANRSSLRSFRGPGLEKGLKILRKVRRLGIPVLTDVHDPRDAARVADAADILQIPAFLCRQTDLLLAAAKTGKPINVKKGQFMSPWDMSNVVEKILSAGNERIMLTERGTCFGYNNLVSDMRSLPIMRSLGCPVVFDATHSVQLPGGRGGSSGGERDMVPYLARAAVAVGADGVFIEAHPAPGKASSDGPNMLRIKDLPALLGDLAAIDRAVRKRVKA